MIRHKTIEDLKNRLPGYAHHWVYTDNGLPLMIVARYNRGCDKTYRQFHLEEGEWVEGMPKSPYPLFGLHSLSHRSPLDAILICEGEKCATVPHHLGWPAIATVLGAQNPGHSDWLPVRHFKRFIILRDNDKAGVSYARAVAIEILRVRPEAEIFVVNLVSSLSGGDLIDWLKSTLLLGQPWNGFEPLPSDRVDSVKVALQHEIEKKLVSVEECPEVDFRPIEARFQGAPRPLDLTLRSVSEFPLQALPDLFGRYLSLLSLQFSQVPDFAATTLVAAVAGLTGRSVHLLMRPHSGWYETTNCWSILVGPPAAKKSPIMRRVFALFKPLEENAAKEFSEANKAYKKKKPPSSGEGDEDVPEPSRRRYITDDATTPKLRQLMASNPRGLILRNDELKGQLVRLDKIGCEGDRSFMMSCWSGLETYSEDRMCRDSSINIPLALTWIGCIPPTALQGYLREAMGHGSGADGFMQRFQMVCYPDNKQQFVLPTQPLPMKLEEEIQKVFLQLDQDSLCSGDRVLQFDGDAQTLFDEWVVINENDARSGRHPLHWESHLGKQAKVIAVVSIVLHRLFEVTASNVQTFISVQTLQKALELQRYFLAHAERCYSSVVGATLEDAKTILGLLKQGRLPPRFKAQDIYHVGLGNLSDSACVRAALELLQDYGWILSEKQAANSPNTGGRRAEFWVLHPRAFDRHEQ